MKRTLSRLLLGLTLVLIGATAFRAEGHPALGDEVSGDEVSGDEVTGDEVSGDEAAGEAGLEGATRSAVILPLREDINPLSGALLKRKFADAVDSGVDVIVIDIHSPGGFTSVTFELMDMLLDATEVETVAFIEKDAISGAALLALAADRIVMLPDARIGDAGEIVMGRDGMFRYTEAKSRSVLAQKARDTARATGRTVALAEKMVDKDMVVFRATRKSDGETAYFSDKEWESMEDVDRWERGKPIREAGEEMFFIANGARAVELGIADETIESRDRLGDALGVSTPIPVIERTWVDTLVLVLNSGVATFLLLLIGMVALVIELSAPGISLGGLTSMLCFGLFFWSRFLGGTAGWLEVTLFVLGLMFIATELFAFPGFGIPGISGIALTFGSLVMASRRVVLPEGSESWTDLGFDVFTVAAAFAGFFIALVALSHYLGDIPGLSRLTLKPQLATGGLAVGSDIDPAMMPGWQRVEVGQTGSTVSPLRPGGKIEVDDYMVDVVTEGEFVESGREVRVIGKQGSRVVVRPV